jgi:hypothetical protein
MARKECKPFFIPFSRRENSKKIETHLEVLLRVEAMQNLDFIVAIGGRASIG